MRAVQVRQFGGPEVLEVAEVDRPVPGVGEVLLRVAGAGVNFADLRTRMGATGHGPLAPLPHIPGLEAVGIVEAIGPIEAAPAADEPPIRPGAAVVAGAARGGYAEYAIAPADLLFPLPPGKSFEEAAAVPVNFTTAWLVLVFRGQVKAGETVLIHAAGGGVGGALVQLARHRGARVVATASSAEKLERAAEMGADALVNYAERDFVEAIRDELGAERPIDVVLDSVGGPVLARSLELLPLWGRLVGYGQASGEQSSIDSYAAIPYNLDLRFISRGAITRSRRPEDRALLREAMAAAMDLWERGAMRPLYRTLLPLDQAAEAHRRLAARETVGKIILVP